MTINQLSIFVENKAGTVAEITKSIAGALVLAGIICILIGGATGFSIPGSLACLY